ncbi:MAG TPA: cytochrome c3 family protein [Terriglobales bacterium]|nr:cytochrome c3 family protein [Terriglobales bacterium]
MASRIFVVLCLVLWTETVTAEAAQIASSDCLACHNDASLVTNEQDKSVSLYVSEKTFQQSVHGILACTDCHTDIKSIPHLG